MTMDEGQPGGSGEPLLWCRERLLDARSRHERSEFELYCQLRAWLEEQRSAGFPWHVQRWVPLCRVLVFTGGDAVAQGSMNWRDARWALQYVITSEDAHIMCAFDIEGPGWRRRSAGAAETEEKRAFMNAAGVHYAHFDLANPAISAASVCRFISNRAAMPCPAAASTFCRCRERLLTEGALCFYAQVLLPLARRHDDEVFMQMRLDALLRADRALRRRLAGCSLDFVIAGRRDTAIRCGVELCGSECGVFRYPGLAAAAAGCGLRLVRLSTDAGLAETEERVYG